MTASRAVADAARRLGDQQRQRIAAAQDAIGEVIATVTTVTAGGAVDGNALVKVTWRGLEVTVNGYLNSYTPTPGDRVLCGYVDSQLIVKGRIVGSPYEPVPPATL